MQVLQVSYSPVRRVSKECDPSLAAQRPALFLPKRSQASVDRRQLIRLQDTACAECSSPSVRRVFWTIKQLRCKEDPHPHLLMSAMSSLNWLFALTAVAVVVIHFVGELSSRGWRRSRKDLRTVPEIIQFINRPGLSLQALLEERAKPNKRLRQAFGLDNAFTTGDPAHRTRFRATAIKLTQPFVDTRRVEEVKQTVQCAIEQWTRKQRGPCSSSTFPFDVFVQHITFSTILAILFPGVGVDEMDIGDV